MRALVVRVRPDEQWEQVLVEDWPEPGRPTGNEVKTQTIYSGITNGTERNILIGGNYALGGFADGRPLRSSGYQNVGRVVETGPDVTGLKVGDVLYMSVPHEEFAVEPEDSLLIKLPPDVDPHHAALFGMGSVAMHTCRNADLRIGERVLIVGLGSIGQLASQVANVMGARVTACDIDPRRLELARDIGAAEEVFDSSGDGWARHIGEGTYDAVIDFAGVPGMEDQLIDAVRRQGRVLLIAGRFKVSYTFNLAQRHEVAIKINSHFDRDDLANLCRLVQRGMVRIGPLIRNVVSVNEAARIYDTLRDRPSELLGTVFVW